MEGFRILGRRPLAFLTWMGVYALVCAMCFGLGYLILAPDLPSLASTFVPGGSEGAGPLLQKARALQNFGTPAGLALQAVLGAAVYRELLRPEASAGGYVRVSGAEALQILANLVLACLLVGGVVLVVVSGLTIAGVSLIATEQQGDGARIITWVALGASGLIAVFGIIYTTVRLSLAPVMTFDAGALRVFESWRMTRGHFWRILFAFVLSGLFSIIVAVSMAVLAGALALAVFSMSGGPSVYAAHGVSFALLRAAWPVLLVAAPPLIVAQVLAITLYKAAAGHIFLALRGA